MDWEADGLLDGLESERERRGRQALLDRLEHQGVPVDELRRAVAEDRLVLVPVERALVQGGERYTLGEVAARAGIPRATFEESLRASGFVVPPAHERLFGDADVESARRTRALLDAGLPLDRITAVVRIMSVGMARIADAVRQVIGESLIRPGDTELELADRYVEAAVGLAPLGGPALEYAFSFHLLEAIRNDAISRTALASGELTAGTEVAVCFADLVGFTRMGQSADPGEIGAIAERLGALAAGAARRPVRLIKQLGDGVMLVSNDPAALLGAATELVSAAEAQADFPALRAGLALGPALERGGDWYGQPVNLASRLCDAARPGTILVSPELRDAVGEADGYRFSHSGRKRLKGIGSMRPYRVRPRSEGSSPPAGRTTGRGTAAPGQPRRP